MIAAPHLDLAVCSPIVVEYRIIFSLCNFLWDNPQNIRGSTHWPWNAPEPPNTGSSWQTRSELCWARSRAAQRPIWASPQTEHSTHSCQFPLNLGSLEKSHCRLRNGFRSPLKTCPPQVTGQCHTEGNLLLSGLQDDNHINKESGVEHHKLFFLARCEPRGL